MSKTEPPKANLWICNCAVRHPLDQLWCPYCKVSQPAPPLTVKPEGTKCVCDNGRIVTTDKNGWKRIIDYCTTCKGTGEKPEEKKCDNCGGTYYLKECPVTLCKALKKQAKPKPKEGLREEIESILTEHVDHVCDVLLALIHKQREKAVREALWLFIAEVDRRPKQRLPLENQLVDRVLEMLFPKE